MCAPNKTKKGNKAFSYLFCTHLAITISAMVPGCLGAMSKMEVFLHQAQQRHDSMNMSRDSTSLKKSSGDCLKLAKQ